MVRSRLKIPPFDPQKSTLETRLSGQAITQEVLHVQWLKSCLQKASNPPDLLQTFANYSANLTPAAVLIPIAKRASQLNLIFTQRSAHLPEHGGQISFPGGRADSTDQDLIATALRETEEEIGLPSASVEVIAQLAPYQTVSEYLVTPVVAYIQQLPVLRMNPIEVESIIEIPFSFFLNPSHYQKRSIEWKAPNGEILKRSFYAIPYSSEHAEVFIWGATAEILWQLFCVLSANNSA